MIAFDFLLMGILMDPFDHHVIGRKYTTLKYFFDEGMFKHLNTCQKNIHIPIDIKKNIQFKEFKYCLTISSETFN